jgi:hypothetical protein
LGKTYPEAISPRRFPTVCLRRYRGHEARKREKHRPLAGEARLPAGSPDVGLNPINNADAKERSACLAKTGRIWTYVQDDRSFEGLSSLFAGLDRCADRAVFMVTLTMMAKLNQIDPAGVACRLSFSHCRPSTLR